MIETTIPTTRVCKNCCLEKPLNDFRNHAKGKYGKIALCKPCAAQRSAKYRSVQKAKYQAYVQRYRASPAGMLNSLMRGARKRNLDFSLTLVDIENNFWSKPCHYCGDKAVGIDRLNNHVGYTMSNCIPCCALCNFMKHTGTRDKYISHCIKVFKYGKAYM